MRFNSILLIAALISGLYAQSVVDSMTYGKNHVEWFSFITEAPVNAFVPVGNNLWYATPGAVGKYNLKTNKKDEYPSLGGISSAGITSAAADRSGNIYLASPNGLIKKSTSGYKLYTEKDGLPSNNVKVVSVQRGRNVWVGTDKGCAVLSGDKWTAFNESGGLAGEMINDIKEAGGKMLFATNKGIAVFDGSAWSKHDMKSGLSSNFVKAIAFDPNEKHVWAAVGEADVNFYNGKKWEVFMDIKPGLNCIMVDTQSRAWFGSATGVIKYNTIEWIEKPDKIGFPASYVGDMYRSGNGDLWFGLQNSILHMKNPYPY